MDNLTKNNQPIDNAALIEQAKAYTAKVTQKQKGAGFTPTNLHIYTDAQGGFLYAKLRLKNYATGDKYIRSISQDSAGKWQMRDPDFERVYPEGGGKKPLYLCHDLACDTLSMVYIFEGEQKAELAQSLGFIATTSGGSTQIDKYYWEPLKGRRVCLWADNDKAGAQWLEQLNNTLKALGCNVQVIDIDKLGLPEKGDIVDWVAMRRQQDAAVSDDELLQAIKKLPILANEQLLLLSDDVAEPSSLILSQGGTQVTPHHIGWPKPEPINQTLPPVNTITDDMMPSTLWLYCQNNAKRLSTPIEYIAVPLLVALSSVIGVKVGAYPKHYDDWDIVPNLWGAIIGNPSTKKSPAIDSGLKPLNNLVHHAKAGYEQAQKDFATQKEVNKHKSSALEGELKALAKKQAKQADDDENLITDDELTAKAQSIAEANEADNNEPILKRYIANDGTHQKLGEILAQTNNGLLIARDELTGLLASLDGEQNNDARNFYLEAFNGTGSHVMDRVGRGSTFIETHCLSVIGGIQPNKLERYLSKTIKGLDNDGLMQRFQLAVYPDHIKGLKEQDIAPDKEIRQAVYDLFEIIDNMSVGDLIKYGANPPDDFNKRPYFYFNDQAYQAFMSWYDDNKAKAEVCEHSVMAEHMMKYPKTIPSLALIFHLVDCIEHQANLGRIGMNALSAALKWHCMLETHMVRIYSLVTDSANIKAAYLSEKLLNMAKNSTDKTDETLWINGGFTARQLIRKGWKGLTDSDDVQNALEVLLENKWLDWQEVPSTGQGGRPTERYYINPRIRELL